MVGEGLVNGGVKRQTRVVRVGDLAIGGGSEVSVQSMCATRTQDLEATLKQISLLEEHGADIIRIAIDSKRDVDALKEIRKQTKARLVVDLQESYKLAELVAPFVQKSATIQAICIITKKMCLCMKKSGTSLIPLRISN